MEKIPNGDSKNFSTTCAFDMDATQSCGQEINIDFVIPQLTQ